MKLCDGLCIVGSGFDGLFLTDRIDCNVYAFDTGAGWALVDAGAGREPWLILNILKRDGIAPEHVKYLLLTHAHGDHMGGAAYFREQLGVQVIAPEVEAGIAARAVETEMGLDVAKAAGYYPQDYKVRPVNAGKVVSPGEMFALGELKIKCYSAKGHSPNGLCYHLEKDGKRLLFTGDLISHGGRISLQDIPGNSLEGHADSVAALLREEVDVFLPGHGLISMQNGGEHIRLAAKELNL